MPRAALALLAALSLAPLYATPASAGATTTAGHDEHAALRLENSRAIGLLSDGRTPVFVHPDKVVTAGGKEKSCRFTLSLDDQPVALDTAPCTATFFPGGVLYTLTPDGGRVEVMHLWSKADPYALFIRTSGRLARASVALSGEFALAAAPTAREADATVSAFSVNGTLAALGWEKARLAAEERHTTRGMILRTPDASLDRAVALNQQLLDFAYNGNYLVCEIFRWTDIWSRDIGSGIIPGCLATGRYEEARKTLEEDLSRHDRATAAALKTTDDASKGGSAEGVSLLACAAWEDYLITGDKDFLARTAKRLAPWVDAWLARDYARRGLVTDVTDWMDHSRHLLLSYGARTLYANACMVRLLDVTAKMEEELGRNDAARRLRAARQRFADAINRELWSAELGAYANLTLGGRRDERSDSGANALALLAGIADPARARTVLDTLRTKNGRPHGSMTITPLMSHVNEHCDQNEKMWPWWMAYEARARFLHGDAAGGAKLLHDCGVAAEQEKYPGLMKEVLSKEGHTEGGCAFVTGAGSVIAAVREGLFGVEILRPGMAEIKVTPCLPAAWKDASLSMPTPGGRIDIVVKDGQTSVTTTDPRIKVIHTLPGVAVSGAARRDWTGRAETAVSADAPVPAPALRPRRAVALRVDGLPGKEFPAALTAPAAGVKDIAGLAADQSLLIAGNGLPVTAPDGTPVTKLMDDFLGRGGQIVFLGAAMENRDRGGPEKMGAKGGVIAWYSKSGDSWTPFDSLSGKPAKAPVRTGSTYWGHGPYFRGWDLDRGLFGFSVQGDGVRPAGVTLLKPLPAPKPAAIKAVFTDFATAAPWYFQPVLTTHTDHRVLLPHGGEDFACVARLVNLATKGEIVLVGEGVTDAIPAPALLESLGIR